MGGGSGPWTDLAGQHFAWRLELSWTRRGEKVGGVVSVQAIN
jgi:hypothetical protein